MFYQVQGDSITYGGRPFLTLGFTPTGRRRELLNDICGWLNRQQEERETETLAALNAE